MTRGLVAATLLSVLAAGCSERVPVPFQRPSFTDQAYLRGIWDGLHIVSSHAELQQYLAAPHDIGEVATSADFRHRRLALLVWTYSGCTDHEPGMLADLYLEDEVLHAVNAGAGGIRCNMIVSLWDAVSFDRVTPFDDTEVSTD